MNVGVTGVLMVIVIDAVVAQAPAVGENVYVVVDMLFTAGAQLPVIPSLDGTGSAGIASPWQ